MSLPTGVSSALRLSALEPSQKRQAEPEKRKESEEKEAVSITVLSQHADFTLAPGVARPVGPAEGETQVSGPAWKVKRHQARIMALLIRLALIEGNDLVPQARARNLMNKVGLLEDSARGFR